MSNGPGNYFYKSGAGGSGSGSGFGSINYITNFGAETDTSTWILYTDAAKNIPQTGANGSGAATSLTFSRSASTPLIGTGQFSMVQANSTSLQGKGVSYPFTIDPAFQSTNLSIQFMYNASSTFVSGDGITAPLNDNTTSTNTGNSDIEVFIYDVTNAALIPVSPQVITGKGTQNYQFKGTFQTASNSTSYRLIFHVASTSANATGWTFLFDNVFVGPQAQLMGSPTTDWGVQSWTPTGAWSTNSTYTGQWRRVGDTMECQVKIALAGAPTSASLTVNMPTGYTIDTTKLVSTTADARLGGGGGKCAGVTADFLVGYNSTTSVDVRYLSSASTGAASAVTQAAPGTFANADEVNLFWRVPIVGWSSTTTMSNDTDTRIVAYRGTNVAGTSIANSGDVQVPFATLDFDTHGAFATPTYTVPVAGKYRVSATVNFASSTYAAGNVIFATIYKNGAVHSISAREDIQAIFTSLIGVSVDGVVSCVAGDTIDIRVQNTRTAGATTLSTTVGDNHLEIERITGPSAIAATDTVAAAYTDTAGSVIGTSNGKYAFATKVFDTHSAYGNSGIYTVPISGKYLISAALTTAGSTILTGNVFALNAFQNNVQKFQAWNTGDGFVMNGSVSIMGILSCTSGDTLSIQARQTTNGSTALTTAGINYFSINRIGN